MALPKLIASWPVVRQLREGDRLGLGAAAQSPRSRSLVPRIDEAEHVVQSVCPYCAVGCGQLVYVKDGEVTHIEGDPASPISRGRLCPKGQASKSYVQSPLREYKVKYRRPYGTEWEELALDDAMEMIADRIVTTRAATGRGRAPGGGRDGAETDAGRSARQPHDGDRQPRRRDARQRGELPDQEADDRPRHRPGR